jgi:cyclic pyranopterin phosphate synthase
VPRRADLKTGTTCNSNCVFCVIGDHLWTGDRATEQCVAELVASRRTCEDVVFTGAEVSIRKDFFHLLEAARRLGYRNVQVQTNGRMFAYRAFTERAVAAGMTELAPSIHGHVARLHDGLTRAPGSFGEVVAGIRHARSLGVRVVSNSVATRQNMKHLPSLARLLVELDVNQFQIAFPHPTGHAATYFDGVVPRMRELAPHVMAALDVGRAAGVACMAEALPYCQLPGYEPEVAELHIPPTEIVYDGFVVPDYARDRMERGKTRFPQCATCRWEPMCEGPWRDYPEHVGDAEFQPVPGPRVLDGAVVLDPRFARLGEPAPGFTLSTGEGMRISLDDVKERWVALAFYPEDGSPACTRELCGLEQEYDRLSTLGVALLGVSRDGPAAHARMRQQHGLRFPLLCDEDGAVARAYGALEPGGAVRRSTYLLGPGRRIDHLLVAPDLERPAMQIATAVSRFEAPPRPLERGPELLMIRRKPRPAAEVERELGLHDVEHN